MADAPDPRAAFLAAVESAAARARAMGYTLGATRMDPGPEAESARRQASAALGAALVDLLDAAHALDPAVVFAPALPPGDAYAPHARAAWAVARAILDRDPIRPCPAPDEPDALEGAAAALRTALDAMKEHPAAAALRADGQDAAAALVQLLNDSGGSAPVTDLAAALCGGVMPTFYSLVSRARAAMEAARLDWRIDTPRRGRLALVEAPRRPR